MARALLAASNYQDVLSILEDKDGITDGFSLNAVFVTGSDVKMYNIEICPGKRNERIQSEVDILPISPGSCYIHCNKYERIDAPQLKRSRLSSTHRMNAIQRHPKPDNIDVVKNVLSDQSDTEYAVFRMGDKSGDRVCTAAVGKSESV